MTDRDFSEATATDSNYQLSIPDRLRYLRDNFSDEIPEEVIHGPSPNNAF